MLSFMGMKNQTYSHPFKKKYFYYIPKPIHPQTNRTDSSYELIELANRGKSIIEHKDSKIKVILIYKLIKNNEKLFTRKVTFIKQSTGG